MMKQAILAILQQRLDGINANISSFEESLAVGLKMQWQFKQDGLDHLKQRITDFKQQKVETESCLAWLNTIEYEQV